MFDNFWHQVERDLKDMTDAENDPPASPPAPSPALGANNNPLLSTHPVVGQVVASVYNDPSVPPAQAAMIVAGSLGTLAQLAPEVFQLTRASAATQAWVGIGIEALASVIGLFFPHPNAAP